MWRQGGAAVPTRARWASRHRLNPQQRWYAGEQRGGGRSSSGEVLSRARQPRHGAADALGSFVSRPLASVGARRGSTARLSGASEGHPVDARPHAPRGGKGKRKARGSLPRGTTSDTQALQRLCDAVATTAGAGDVAATQRACAAVMDALREMALAEHIGVRAGGECGVDLKEWAPYAGEGGEGVMEVWAPSPRPHRDADGAGGGDDGSDRGDTGSLSNPGTMSSTAKTFFHAAEELARYPAQLVDLLERVLPAVAECVFAAPFGTEDAMQWRAHTPAARRHHIEATSSHGATHGPRPPHPAPLIVGPAWDLLNAAATAVRSIVWRPHIAYEAGGGAVRASVSSSVDSIRLASSLGCCLGYTRLWTSLFNDNAIATVMVLVEQASPLPPRQHLHRTGAGFRDDGGSALGHTHAAAAGAVDPDRADFWLTFAGNVLASMWGGVAVRAGMLHDLPLAGGVSYDDLMPLLVMLHSRAYDNAQRVLEDAAARAGCHGAGRVAQLLRAAPPAEALRVRALLSALQGVAVKPPLAPLPSPSAVGVGVDHESSPRDGHPRRARTAGTSHTGGTGDAGGGGSRAYTAARDERRCALASLVGHLAADLRAPRGVLAAFEALGATDADFAISAAARVFPRDSPALVVAGSLHALADDVRSRASPVAAAALRRPLTRNSAIRDVVHAAVVRALEEKHLDVGDAEVLRLLLRLMWAELLPPAGAGAGDGAGLVAAYDSAGDAPSTTRAARPCRIFQTISRVAKPQQLTVPLLLDMRALLRGLSGLPCGAKDRHALAVAALRWLVHARAPDPNVPAELDGRLAVFAELVTLSGRDVAFSTSDAAILKAFLQAVGVHGGRGMGVDGGAGAGSGDAAGSASTCRAIAPRVVQTHSSAVAKDHDALPASPEAKKCGAPPSALWGALLEIAHWHPSGGEASPLRGRAAPASDAIAHSWWAARLRHALAALGVPDVGGALPKPTRLASPAVQGVLAAWGAVEATAVGRVMTNNAFETRAGGALLPSARLPRGAVAAGPLIVHPSVLRTAVHDITTAWCDVLLRCGVSEDDPDLHALRVAPSVPAHAGRGAAGGERAHPRSTGSAAHPGAVDAYTVTARLAVLSTKVVHVAFVWLREAGWLDARAHQGRGDAWTRSGAREGSGSNSNGNKNADGIADVADDIRARLPAILHVMIARFRAHEQLPLAELVGLTTLAGMLSEVLCRTMGVASMGCDEGAHHTQRQEHDGGVPHGPEAPDLFVACAAELRKRQAPQGYPEAAVGDLLRAVLKCETVHTRMGKPAARGRPPSYAERSVRMGSGTTEACAVAAAPNPEETAALSQSAVAQSPLFAHPRPVRSGGLSREEWLDLARLAIAGLAARAHYPNPTQLADSLWTLAQVALSLFANYHHHAHASLGTGYVSGVGAVFHEVVAFGEQLFTAPQRWLWRAYSTAYNIPVRIARLLLWCGYAGPQRVPRLPSALHPPRCSSAHAELCLQRVFTQEVIRNLGATGTRPELTALLAFAQGYYAVPYDLAGGAEADSDDDGLDDPDSVAMCALEGDGLLRIAEAAADTPSSVFFSNAELGCPDTREIATRNVKCDAAVPTATSAAEVLSKLL